jgi:hypothetical protein
MASVQLRDTDIVTVYDPARSRETEYKHNARNAIMTTACDSDYNVFVLRYWARRASLDEIFEELHTHADLYHPRVIGVEDVAVQIAIGDAFVKQAKSNAWRIPPVEGLRPDTRVNKKWRIKTHIQRVAPYGRLYIPADSWELRAEWSAFPNGRTIDILDVLAYAIQLHNIPDSVSSRSHNNDMKQRMAAAQGVVIDLDAERESRYAVAKPPNGAIVRRLA